MCIRDSTDTGPKKLQEHTTAQLRLLRGDLRCELNGQEARLSTGETFVSNIEEAISIKVSVAVEESATNKREQIKSEVKLFMKI